MANESFPVVNRGASILPYLTWGSQDPTATPIPGIPGMLYVQIANPDDLEANVGIYQKILTAGLDTNWQKIGPGGGGGGGVTGIGAIDSQTKSANGAVIVGTNLYMQSADDTNPGLLSVVAQQIAGEKTFLEAIVGQEIATPANPPAGFLKLYFKNDGKLYQLDSSGTEIQLTPESVTASQVAYAPAVPSNWPVSPANVQDALDEVASILNLRSNIEIYVDAVAGDDATGTGSILRPYQTLEAALAAYAAGGAGNYVILLAPGSYGAAPISIPIQANKSLGILGTFAGACFINQAISYVSLGLSEESFYLNQVSVNAQITFDLSLGGVVNILLANGRYSVKRIDTLPPGPQVIRIFNSFTDGFDISGTCLMTGCQFVGGSSNIVQPAGFLLMTSCLFASMTAQIDGILLLAATLAQGTSLTGSGTVQSDASSLFGLGISGPNIGFTDNASKVGYDPAVPANWLVAPTQVAQALDELASRISSNEIFFTGTRYVAKNGSDVTGDGSLTKPFLTVKAAMASITDATNLKRYVICVMPGRYTETGLTLKANVFVVGLGQNWFATRIANNVAIPLDADFSVANDIRSGFANINIASALAFDFNAVSSNEGKVYIWNCQVTSAATFTKFSAINQVTIQDCQCFGLVTFNGCNSEMVDNDIFGGVTVNAATGVSTELVMSGNDIQAPIQIVGNGTDNVSVEMGGNLCESTVAISGGLAVLNADVSSLPDESNVTVSGGATINRLSSANWLKFNPAVPGDWAVPPTQVKQALDELAAAVTAGSGANKSLSNLIAPTLNTSIDANGKDWNNGNIVEAVTAKIGADKLPIVEGSVAGGNDAFTKYLLHADNNATDSSASAHVPLTNTMAYGAGHFAQAFDCSGGGKRLTYTSDSDVNFGTGDFTIDFWATYVGGGNQHAVNRWLFAGGDWYVAFVGGNTARFGCPALGITLDRVSASLADGLFHHIAIERQGNNFNIAIDGVWGTAIVNAGSVPFTPSTNFAVGAISDTFTDQFLSKIDELRVSKGIARWSQASSFVPPTSPYASSDPAFDFGNKELLSSAPPTASSSLTNKAYVDSHQTLVVEHIITAPEAAAKQFALADAPRDVNNVSLAVGGVEQVATVDFNVTGSIITWSGLGLDTIGVVAGDVFVLTYEKG